MSTAFWVGVSVLLLCGKLVLDLVRWYLDTRKTPFPDHLLPPGPPGLPLVGNVMGLNAPWLTYDNWAQTYGDLIHTRLFGKHIVVISSEKIAKDLLEHRSKNYSDRPSLVANALYGVDFNSILLPYGDQWRLHRRFFHQTFRAGAIPKFAPMQEQKSFQLLRRLLHAPTQYSDHIYEFTAAVVMKAVYDYDPVSRKDPIVDIVDRVVSAMVDALRPDVAILIGAFPWLFSLPSWLPGMSFKRTAVSSRVLAKDCVEMPFNYTVQKMASRKAGSSMISDALQKAKEEDIPRDSTWMRGLKESAATAFMAASETSNSVIVTFLLMMLQFPDAQKKAQSQIDAVVGKDRLPRFQDRPSLPFIDALIRETLRYNPVAPLSVPHVTVDADVYEGYHIPKGALVISNLWSMAHNASKYPRPYEFLPERFLNDDGTLKPDDTQNIAFGFGRRMCVGRYFADASVWIAIARILAVFRVERERDENGEVPVEPKFTSGVAVHPLPFPCRIVPRVEGMDEEMLERLVGAGVL